MLVWAIFFYRRASSVENSATEVAYNKKNLFEVEGIHDGFFLWILDLYEILTAVKKTLNEEYPKLDWVSLQILSHATSATLYHGVTTSSRCLTQAPEEAQLRGNAFQMGLS